MMVITTGITLYIILVINCTYKNCNLCNPLKTVVGKCSILLPAKFLYTWWRFFWAYRMKVILSVNDDGYFEWTWWRLFQKRIICTTFDIKIEITAKPNNLVLGTIKPKDLNRRAVIGQGHICLREENLSLINNTFDILYMCSFYFKGTRTVFTFILYSFDLTGI
jgi:hypothetical protein